MKSPFLFIVSIIFILSSCEQVKESTVHRRNFSKNVFEDEFASVQVGCDTFRNIVFLPNTKWIDIDDAHISHQNSDLHAFEMNKMLKATERTYKHELILEKVENGAFMFRYTGKQVFTDTILAITEKKANAISTLKVNPSRIFSFEGTSYLKLSNAQADSIKHETIYKNMNTVDKGRVVCTCDYFTNQDGSYN